MQKIKKTHYVVLEKNVLQMDRQTDRWTDEKD